MNEPTHQRLVAFAGLAKSHVHLFQSLVDNHEAMTRFGKTVLVPTNASMAIDACYELEPAIIGALEAIKTAAAGEKADFGTCVIGTRVSLSPYHNARMRLVIQTAIVVVGSCTGRLYDARPIRAGYPQDDAAKTALRNDIAWVVEKIRSDRNTAEAGIEEKYARALALAIVGGPFSVDPIENNVPIH